ncbi:ThiF family adenylyltransferase [Phytoactinopolyspora mesophila]|uniref:Thiamine biosynthesis protein ThiF n=1 Tax=Phytoactinopolyspora mesophila TaxID=2650750 RepID=A0A7K3MCM4_9ACTN|nr:ThiF family adenylyltransferase [Phytoactinopolyspora mesophila]NDL61043.1 thiamine biosynthesis protein ThiF [Phytoactinopolyspora mesophila]
MWRDATTLQVGITPGRALVVGGLGPIETAVLRALDGHNTMATLREIATKAGAEPGVADRLVDMLFSAGAAVDQDQLRGFGSDPQFLPDRASLGLVERCADGGGAAFERRNQRRVDVVGAGRVGATIARLLAAGGIGDVGVDDHTLVTPADVSPGGHPAEAVGLARDRSLGEILPTRTDLADADLDFVVLAPDDDAGTPHVAAGLRHGGVPHLLVRVVETTGVVGPLVVPGSSTCLHCLDLHRTDRDRDWPAVVDQVARKPTTTPPCDASLATAVASMAAGHVLGYLDGYDVASVNGTVDLELPYGLPRRRSWRPHPDCECRGAEASQ